MSRVYVLASDRELPLQDCQELRTQESGGYSITLLQGFKVDRLDYYHQAVEELGYPMKPFRYEFTLEKEEADLKNLQAYLTENFSQGESLELWSVWVHDDVNKKCPPRFRGRLKDLDMDALEQFLTAQELCFTITV